VAPAARTGPVAAATPQGVALAPDVAALLAALTKRVDALTEILVNHGVTAAELDAAMVFVTSPEWDLFLPPEADVEEQEI
jgi:hypothetical protein